MFQSLARGSRVDDFVEGYGQVIVDECHHVPAVQFERVLSETKARYVIGLTATPKRRDGHHPILEMQLGPVRHTISSKSVATSRTFAHRLIVRETNFSAPVADDRIPIQTLYAALARDAARNDLIVQDILCALQEGRSPIVLTERKDHLEHLARRLGQIARHLIVLRGGMGAAEDRLIRARLQAVPVNEERVILATGRYAGERDSTTLRNASLLSGVLSREGGSRADCSSYSRLGCQRGHPRECEPPDVHSSKRALCHS
jgi:hypothetical protein